MSARFLNERFFPCHFVTMAHKVHIGQQFDDFSAFESAISQYQNNENVQFFKRDSRSLEAAKGRVSNKTFNPRIKYYEVTYHCIRGGKNFKPRGTGKKETRYLSIYHRLSVSLFSNMSLIMFITCMNIYLSIYLSIYLCLSVSLF